MKKRKRSFDDPVLQTVDRTSISWSIVVYADDLPEDWMDRLEGSGVRYVGSVLHDNEYVKPMKGLHAGSDVCLAPHYHLSLVFDHRVGFLDVDALFDHAVDICRDLPDCELAEILSVLKSDLICSTGL